MDEHKFLNICIGVLLASITAVFAVAALGVVIIIIAFIYGAIANF